MHDIVSRTYPLLSVQGMSELIDLTPWSVTDSYAGGWGGVPFLSQQTYMVFPTICTAFGHFNSLADLPKI